MMAHRTKISPLVALAAGLIATPLLAGTAMAQMASQTAGGPAAAPATSDGMSTQAIPVQQISSKTITKAGKALHNVLAINQRYGAKLSKVTNPADKQKLVANAKEKAMGAIAGQGLSVNQYNEVLASAQQNPAVRAQLLSAAGVQAKD